VSRQKRNLVPTLQNTRCSRSVVNSLETVQRLCGITVATHWIWTSFERCSEDGSKIAQSRLKPHTAAETAIWPCSEPSRTMDSACLASMHHCVLCALGIDTPSSYTTAPDEETSLSGLLGDRNGHSCRAEIVRGCSGRSTRNARHCFMTLETAREACASDLPHLVCGIRGPCLPHWPLWEQKKTAPNRIYREAGDHSCVLVMNQPGRQAGRQANPNRQRDMRPQQQRRR
jgi:hypothetical protein